MKIVFSDIDGTFMSMGGTVAPKINRDAVTALQEQGDRFVFISGRNYPQVQEFLSNQEIDCDIIFSNGAGMRMKGEKPQFTHTLSLGHLEEILEVLEEYNCFYHIHTSEKVVLKPMSHYKEHMLKVREALICKLGEEQGGYIGDYKEEYFTNQCRHEEDIITYFKEHPEVHILKIEFMDKSDSRLKNVQNILNDMGFLAFSSFVCSMEVVDPKSSKGAAINRYISMYDNVKSYGIGDGENDISMFEVVDEAIAMNNASDVVKTHSNQVIGDCEEGGLGRFVFETLIRK